MDFDKVPDPNLLFDVSIVPYFVKLKRELLQSKIVEHNDPDGIQYSWEVTQISDTVLEMRVNLANPYEVSVGSTIHVLSITQKDKSLL